MHLFNLCIIKIKLCVYTQAKRKSCCVVKNKPLMKRRTYQIFVEGWRECTVPQIHTWTHIFNTVSPLLFSKTWFWTGSSFPFLTCHTFFFCSAKMVPSWIWTMSTTFTKLLWIKSVFNALNPEQASMWTLRWARFVQPLPLSSFFFNVNISLVM